jgi:uncharacterized protein YndB with AHSA1/START domain
MSTKTRVMDCTPERLFQVLSDGWSLSTWVVGAARIRDVSADWPSPGGTIHHSIGAWPLLLDDTTTVRRYEPPHLLELTVRAWPFGEGTVRLTCHPDGAGTRVSMVEEPDRGPARLVPRPLRDFVLDRRNAEALMRLALLAERAGSPPDG